MSEKSKVLIWLRVLRTVFVRLFFTGIAYFLASSLVLFAGHDLQGGSENCTFLEWLQESPGSWLLYAYVILSFLFFHYGFRLASRVRFRWRIPLYFTVCALFFGVFWLTSISIIHHYQTRHYEHQSVVEDNPLGERLQDQMSAINSCVTNSAYPEVDSFDSQTAQPGLFDPNYYFSVFTNLYLEAEYELDYAFHRDWFAGKPRIYIRKADGSPLIDEDKSEWYFKIHLNGTPESYLEYAALYLFADQFYLSGHAAQGSEGQAVASKTEFEKLINGRLRRGPESARRACVLDFFPRVVIGEEHVEISIATYSPWGGLVRKTVVVEKEFPHRVLGDDFDWETLIDYDCGIRF